MNGVNDAQLHPKVTRLPAGLESSTEKARLASIVARAIVTISVLKKTCSIRRKENEDLAVDQQTGQGRKGCAQKNTAKLYLHIGYQAEETGRIAHERNMAKWLSC